MRSLWLTSICSSQFNVNGAQGAFRFCSIEVPSLYVYQWHSKSRPSSALTLIALQLAWTAAREATSQKPQEPDCDSLLASRTNP